MPVDFIIMTHCAVSAKKLKKILSDIISKFYNILWIFLLIRMRLKP